MAIYFLEVLAASRLDGRSAPAAAAYRSGAILLCERDGVVHDYKGRWGLEDRFILAPVGCGWASDRTRLWNEVEKAERRRDAKLFRELRVALPWELDKAGRKKAAAELGQWLVDTFGVGVDVAIHEPGRDGDDRNFHLHILMTTRSLTPNGLGPKTRKLDVPKLSGVEVERIRAKWTEIANAALETAGFNDRITHLSYARQGNGLRPQRHMGPAATALERRHGEATEWGDQNRAAAFYNAELLAARAECERSDRELRREVDKDESERLLARARTILNIGQGRWGGDLGLPAAFGRPKPGAGFARPHKTRNVSPPPTLVQPEKRDSDAPMTAVRARLDLRGDLARKSRRRQEAEDVARSAVVASRIANAHVQAEAERDQRAAEEIARARTLKRDQAMRRRQRIPTIEETDALVARVLKRSICDVRTDPEPVRFLTPEVKERGWHFGDPVEGPVAALMRRLDVWYIRHAREGGLNGWHYVVIAAPSGIAYQLSLARSRTEVAADLWLLRAARQASIHAEEKQRLMAAARPAARKSPQLPMPKPQPTIGPRQAPTSIRSEVAVREATQPPGPTVEFTPSQAAADALLASALAAGARSRAADRTSHAEEKQRLMAAARPAARKSPQLPMPKPQPTIGPRQAPTSIRSEVAVREATQPPGPTVEFTPSQAAADALLASALAAGARSRAADRTSHAEEKQRLMAAARPAARKSPQLPMPKPQPTIGPRQAPTSIRSEVREATQPPGPTLEFTPSQAAADALLASALAAGARSRAADRTSKDGPLVGQTPAVNRGPPAAGRPEVVPIAPPPPAPIHKTLLQETGSRATPFLAPEKARSQAPVRDPASPTELGQKTAAARLRAPVVWERERGFADFFTTPCRSAAQDGRVHLARLEAMLTEMGVVAAATHSRVGTPRMTRLRVKISDLATALGRLTESQCDQYEKRLREATAEAHKNYAEHRRMLRAQGMEI